MGWHARGAYVPASKSTIAGVSGEGSFLSLFFWGEAEFLTMSGCGRRRR